MLQRQWKGDRLDMDELKTGDVVQLKSGGPHMTITQVGVPAYQTKECCWCTWISSKGESKTEVYPPEALQLVPDNS